LFAEKEIVRRIVERYGSLSGPDLANLTKQSGGPWSTARGDLPPDARSKEEIRKSAMSEYHRRHGITPEASDPAITALAERFFDGDDDALAESFERVTGVRPSIR